MPVLRLRRYSLAILPLKQILTPLLRRVGLMARLIRTSAMANTGTTPHRHNWRSQLQPGFGLLTTLLLLLSVTGSFAQTEPTEPVMPPSTPWKLLGGVKHDLSWSRTCDGGECNYGITNLVAGNHSYQELDPGSGEMQYFNVAKVTGTYYLHYIQGIVYRYNPRPHPEGNGEICWDLEMINVNAGSCGSDVGVFPISFETIYNRFDLGDQNYNDGPSATAGAQAKIDQMCGLGVIDPGSGGVESLLEGVWNAIKTEDIPGLSALNSTVGLEPSPAGTLPNVYWYPGTGCFNGDCNNGWPFDEFEILDPMAGCGPCPDPGTCPPNKHWDTSVCKCVCNEVLTCPTGQKWDDNECKCVPDGPTGPGDGGGKGPLPPLDDKPPYKDDPNQDGDPGEDDPDGPGDGGGGGGGTGPLPDPGDDPGPRDPWDDPNDRDCINCPNPDEDFPEEDPGISEPARGCNCPGVGLVGSAAGGFRVRPGDRIEWYVVRPIWQDAQNFWMYEWGVVSHTIPLDQDMSRIAFHRQGEFLDPNLVDWEAIARWDTRKNPMDLFYESANPPAAPSAINMLTGEEPPPPATDTPDEPKDPAAPPPIPGRAVPPGDSDKTMLGPLGGIVRSYDFAVNWSEDILDDVGNFIGRHGPKSIWIVDYYKNAISQATNQFHKDNFVYPNDCGIIPYPIKGSGGGSLFGGQQSNTPNLAPNFDPNGVVKSAPKLAQGVANSTQRSINTIVHRLNAGMMGTFSRGVNSYVAKWQQGYSSASASGTDSFWIIDIPVLMSTLKIDLRKGIPGAPQFVLIKRDQFVWVHWLSTVFIYLFGAQRAWSFLRSNAAEMTDTYVNIRGVPKDDPGDFKRSD